MDGFRCGILAQRLVSILFLDLPPSTSEKRLIGSWVAQELISKRPGRQDSRRGERKRKAETAPQRWLKDLA